MGVNDKVGVIQIGLKDHNPITNQLIEWINRKYRNVYDIAIYDYSDRLDEGIHIRWKTMIEEKTLIRFGLGFGGSLCNSNDALRLIKEYNSIIKRQEHLGLLQYVHSRIDKLAQSREDIDQLIEKVDSLE